MKKILLTLFVVLNFGIFSGVFANDIVRYSEYSNDWTLDKQFFDIGDESLSKDDYKSKTFIVGTWDGNNCVGTGTDLVDHSSGKGEIEIVGNNADTFTFWKFKPLKGFKTLKNGEFIKFCYGTGADALSSKIIIKKSGNGLSLKTVGSGDQQKVVISKQVGDNGTDIEVSLRCEPNDVAYDNISTGEMDEKFLISLKNLDLKTNNDDFRVKIEGNSGDTGSGVDTDSTFFDLKGDSVNANFYYRPKNEDLGNSTGNLVLNNISNYISKYPDALEMSLYKGNLSRIDDIFDSVNHPLYAKGNGIFLSTNISPVVGGETEQYSLVTHIKGSTATPTIKVYSVSRDGVYTYQDDYKISISDNSGNIISTGSITTAFQVNLDKINVGFKFDPKDISNGTDAKIIMENKNELKLFLYTGSILSKNISSTGLVIVNGQFLDPVCNSNGINLFCNLDLNKSVDYTLIGTVGSSWKSAVLKKYTFSKKQYSLNQNDFTAELLGLDSGDKISSGSTVSSFFITDDKNVDMKIGFNPDTQNISAGNQYILSNPDSLKLSIYTGTILKWSDIGNKTPIVDNKGLNIEGSLDLNNNFNYTLVAVLDGNTGSALYKTYGFGKLNLNLYTKDFKVNFTDGENQINNSLNTKFLIKGDNISPEFVFNPDTIEDGSNAKYIIDHPTELTMTLYTGSTVTGTGIISSTGTSLSTNINDFSNGGIYTLQVKLGDQTLTKTYSFSKDGILLKSNDFKISVEGNGDSNVKDSKETFFSLLSDNVNLNFSYNPDDIANYSVGSITKNPSSLSLSLYEGKVDSYDNLLNFKLLSKTTGLDLSYNLSVKTQEGYNVSLVATYGGTSFIKVYSLSRYGAKIISSDVFPSIASAGSDVKFDIIANIYNSLSDLDYAQIVFDDDRFEKLNLKLDSSTGAGTGETLGKELTFSGKYTLPSDNSINGQFIGYKVYVILKDGTRTELAGKKEIYVGTRNDICKDPKMCVLRGLKALKNTVKSSFEKVLIKNFDKDESNFTENDLYKIFRKQ